MVLLVLLGIWSLLKAELNPKNRYFWGLIAGFSFSLGFFFRSFMIFMPIIALLPYLILQHRRHHHLANPMLYLGFALGLIPTLIWLRFSFLRFGDNSFIQLIHFVNKLSSSERRYNNWTYYFWNLSILAFPWSFHGLLGAGLVIKGFLLKNNVKFSQNPQKNSYSTLQNTNNINSKTIVKYLSILIGFPLTLFIELSIFSTRLSHYSLCLYPFIALLAAVGLNWLGMIWNQDITKLKRHNAPFFSNLSFFRILQNINYVFAALAILLILVGIVIFFVSDSDGEIRNYAIIGLVLGLSWLILPLIWIARCCFGKNLITARYWISAWLISSWLSLATTGTNGFLSNYNPDFKAFLEQPKIVHILQKNPINFVDVGGKTGVLINFYTPKHGRRVDEISQLPASSFAWIPEKQASQILLPHRVIGEVQKYQLIKLD